MKKGLLFSLFIISSFSTLYSQSFDVEDIGTEPTSSALFEDLDGDGILEIIGISNSFTTKGVYVWKRVSVDPIAYEKTQILPDGQNYSSNISGGDLDNDGDYDIILSVGDNKVPTILINESTPEELSFSELPILNILDVSLYRIGDLNGDEILDVVAVDLTLENTVILMGNENLTYDLTTLDDDNNYATDIRIADMDGDGDADIIIASDNGGVDLFENDGNGNFDEIRIYEDSYGDVARVKLSDFNNDGLYDIIAVSDGFIADSNGFILLNNGDGTYEFLDLPTVGRSQGIGLIDVNFDGRGDIVIGQRDASALLFTRDEGDEVTFTQSAFSGFTGISDLVPGDADDDGDDDFVAVISNQFSTFIAINNNPILSNSSELEITDVTIFPNPTYESIYLSGDFVVISDMKIYDMNGQCVKSINGGVIAGDMIDISELPVGNYHVVGSTDKSVIRSMFSKL